MTDDDVVLDLGSGDGRIVFTAARANAKLKGHGVDIDPKLVREANEDAKKYQMSDRVQFELRDVFDADLKEATVITMWLWPEMQRTLRTKILAEARPGPAEPARGQRARRRGLSENFPGATGRTASPLHEDILSNTQDGTFSRFSSAGAHGFCFLYQLMISGSETNRRQQIT